MGTHLLHGPAGSSPPEEEEGEGVEFFPVGQKIFEMPSVRAHDDHCRRVMCSVVARAPRRAIAHAVPLLVRCHRTVRSWRVSVAVRVLGSPLM